MNKYGGGEEAGDLKAKHCIFVWGGGGGGCGGVCGVGGEGDDETVFFFFFFLFFNPVGSWLL